MSFSRLFSMTSVLLIILCVGMASVGMLMQALFILGTIVLAGIAIAVVNWQR